MKNHGRCLRFLEILEGVLNLPDGSSAPWLYLECREHGSECVFWGAEVRAFLTAPVDSRGNRHVRFDGDGSEAVLLNPALCQIGMRWVPGIELVGRMGAVAAITTPGLPLAAA